MVTLRSGDVLVWRTSGSSDRTLLMNGAGVLVLQGVDPQEEGVEV